MKKTFLFTILLASAALLTGNSGLTQTCVDGVSFGGGCAPGRVTFTGTSYPDQVHVHVTRNSNGEEYDDWDYQTDAGALNFTETLSPGDQYTVTVTDNNGNTQQYVVRTGASYSNRDND
jgi:hypothetical protein